MQNKLKGTGILVGFLVALAVAWRLGLATEERALAVGVLGGYLLGAAVTLWGIEYQKHVARTRPAAIWTAFTISFLVKLAGLGVAPAFLYLVPALGERCDWRSLLIAYGFSAVLVLLVGSPEVARALRPKDPQSGGADSALDSRTSIRHG